MSNTQTKSGGKGCLEPFTLTFNYSNPGNYKSNNKKYTQKTLYDISQKNMESDVIKGSASNGIVIKGSASNGIATVSSDTDKSKRRIEIIFNHYGRHHGYFD